MLRPGEERGGVEEFLLATIRCGIGAEVTVYCWST